MAIIKEYLWASFVTFVVAFGAAISSLHLQNFDQAAAFAALAVAAREGGRAVMNMLVTRLVPSKTTSISSREVVK